MTTCHLMCQLMYTVLFKITTNNAEVFAFKIVVSLCQIEQKIKRLMQSQQSN